MPIVSRKQFRFMEAVKSGSLKVPGLSRQKAAEFISGQSPKGLPEKAAALDRIAKRHRPDWEKSFRTGKLDI